MGGTSFLFLLPVHLRLAFGHDLDDPPQGRDAVAAGVDLDLEAAEVLDAVLALVEAADGDVAGLEGAAEDGPRADGLGAREGDLEDVVRGHGAEDGGRAGRLRVGRGHGVGGQGRGAGGRGLGGVGRRDGFAGEGEDFGDDLVEDGADLLGLGWWGGFER